MPKLNSPGRCKPTSFRPTPSVQKMLEELTAQSADQTDAINVAIIDSWWLRIGQHNQFVKQNANLKDANK